MKLARKAAHEVATCGIVRVVVRLSRFTGPEAVKVSQLLVLNMHSMPRTPLCSSSNRSMHKDLPTSSPAQLLLAPPLAALSSSIFSSLFLNSTYWHFSYECLSSCSKHIQPRPAAVSGVSMAYHAFPRQVIFFEPTPIEGNEEMGATVPVG